MIANDVISQLGNQSGYKLGGRTVPWDSKALDGNAWGAGLAFSLPSGQESGFNRGWTPGWLTTESYVWIWHYSADTPCPMILVRFSNALIGTPKLTMWRCTMWWERWHPAKEPEVPVHDDGTLLGTIELPENGFFQRDVPDMGLRVVAHRWTNGKEQLDDYDEWYTRLYVAAHRL